MIIRREQADAFRGPMAESFEARMVDYLHTAHPAEVRQLDDGELRALIRDGVRRAAQYDIVRERDVAQFIDLMFSVRRDFDTSPETAWTTPILTDKTSSAENRLRRVRVKAASAGGAADRRGSFGTRRDLL